VSWGAPPVSEQRVAPAPIIRSPDLRIERQYEASATGPEEKGGVEK